MPSKIGISLIVASLVAVLLVAAHYVWGRAFPLQPEGTTILVNTATDSLVNDGLCSLREAIRAANQDLAVDVCPAGQGADIIILGAQVYTLALLGINEEAALTGDLDITADLEIQGAGVASTIISANSIDRVFHIDPPGTGIQVKFSDLTIQGGSASPADDEGGGGILNNATLTLENVVLKDNSANRGGGIRIALSGETTISDATIQGNQADDEGGGIYGDGPIDLYRVLLTENNANRGGAVFCDRPCTFYDVTIHDNSADSNGGGLYNDDVTVLINNTIDHNFADDYGGGIYNSEDLTMKNVTVSTNTANIGSGVFTDTTAHLLNVTIYRNTSPIKYAALYNASTGYLDLVNTIIARDDKLQPNCFGDFQSLGYNLSSDATCDFSQMTDLKSLNPLLSSLENNGGYTKTHALQTGSPAIDAGNNTTCLSNDQRYLSRPVDGNRDGAAFCDIGAYEIMLGGSFRFSQLSYPVAESVGSVQIAVERTEGSAGQVSVNYFTWDGFSPDRAFNNADYLFTSGKLTWQDGDNAVKYIYVPIVDDPAREYDESFSVILSAPTGGAGLVSTARITIVTIQDNDPTAPWATPVPEPDRTYLPLIND